MPGALRVSALLRFSAASRSPLLVAPLCALTLQCFVSLLTRASRTRDHQNPDEVAIG
jgi:hypothetical protein